MNFLRSVTPFGKARSNCTLPCPGTTENSSSTGAAGFSIIAPIGRRWSAFSFTGCSVLAAMFRQDRFGDAATAIGQEQLKIGIAQRRRLLDKRHAESESLR